MLLVLFHQKLRCELQQRFDHFAHTLITVAPRLQVAVVEQYLVTRRLRALRTLISVQLADLSLNLMHRFLLNVRAKGIVAKEKDDCSFLRRLVLDTFVPLLQLVALVET